jgi:hypothetical protein
MIDEQRDAYLSLWAAAIQVAISDVLMGGPSLDARMPREWVASNAIEQRSFLWACDMLSIDPDAVRERCGLTAPSILD